MGCEPTQATRRFTLASRATRLPCVPTMLPSASFGSRFWVLAGFGDRTLKYREKTRPNRNGRGSPKLRLRAIQSPTLDWRRVYEVRSVPANPFEKTEKSVPVGATSMVRNGDNGGATGIRTLETVSRLHTFQACAFDHSATAPFGVLYRQFAHGCKPEIIVPTNLRISLPDAGLHACSGGPFSRFFRSVPRRFQRFAQRGYRRRAANRPVPHLPRCAPNGPDPRPSAV